METNKRYFSLLTLIILVGFFLRYLYFIQLDGWFDEWNMFYTVDPSLSIDETWQRYFGDRGDHTLPEYYPPLNAFVLKSFLNIFGYSVENARLLTLVFGFGSIILVYYLTKIFTTQRNSLITTCLASFNLFLIWQSSEIRPHSFVVFFSLLNIIFFFNLLRKNNIINSFLYTLSSVLILSSWPFTLIIFFGKLIFLFQDFLINKKKNILINTCIIFSLLIYIFLNYEYLLYHLARDEHYTKLYLGFFYSYHFRSFFGSIFIGGIFLIIFSIMVLYNLKNIIFKNSKENLLILIIISSYFLTITYSIIGASVISPKYVIFILPLIIVWVTLKILDSNFKYKNYFLYILIFISIISSSINIYNNPIDRPPTKKMLKIISSSKVNKIFTSETIVFNNFLKSHKIFKKNSFEVENMMNFNSSEKSFWFLCLNNPRFAVGDNNLPDEKKCKFFQNKDDYLLKDEIRQIDYILRLYEKKI